ncbi:MAG: nucleoside triphosphate pyrophosphohydrolase family protein [Candidatus Diapherotrites archaeon]|nr:nucleoside triphosphate pyrophosphohydrolase family protein [Candidatus Diapherotrites archaeon]MBT4596991.1 nucleoside triphosphate pyrophosphohydrolase family protein [Candidatus Diapherotrites archaeon]
MNLDEYQERAKRTDLNVISKENNLDYYALGLVSEAGEFAGRMKIIHRNKDGVLSEVDKQGLAGELGDALWYISALADKLGFTLADIAENNLRKLYMRKENHELKVHGADK